MKSHSSRLYKNTWNMFFLTLLLMYGVSGSETDESEPVSVMKGDSVTLHTNLSEILNDDTILWMFGPKNDLISQIECKGGSTSFSFSKKDVGFKGRLQVDQSTGSLTIRNTRIRHSGQYKLTISRQKTTIKIFNVTVSGVVVETDGVKSVSVTEGESVTLHNGAEMHKDDLMLWRFGDKGLLLAKIDVETTETSLNDDDERFRDRLKLDQTGSLTITNTRTTDSGLYELQIRGTESSQRFILSVNANGLSSYAVAGIVVGVLVILLLPVAAAFALPYIRNSKLKKQMAVTECEENEETSMEGNAVTPQTVPIAMQVEVGHLVLFQISAEIQTDDLILWTFGAENRLVVKADSEMTIGERFRDRVQLNKMTGNLTIRNITTNDAGHYNLQIINSEQTTFRRFNVTVTDPSADQVDKESDVQTPLLNRNKNEQQATSSV
ncbi:uncharacterized protein [Pseudorasbora parva]|uniref:uncharacterized protein n=1 Tax=Pseudorasbora parva TaxID=51549 RepID=UPI00351E8D89